MAYYWIIMTLISISYAFYTVNAIDEFQQPFSSIILKEQKYDDTIHTTYWATQFFSPPLLTNTTLLYVTGIISIIVWLLGYMIDYLIERQEQMAMELGKQKQASCSLYGAI